MISRFLQFSAALTIATSTLAQGQQSGFDFNIDITNFSAPCIAPGESVDFEVITRLSAAGNPSIGLQNIRYTINLGSLTTITFSGTQADGSLFTTPTATYGTVGLSMFDAIDADNPFLPSTSAADIGILTAAGDALDRPDLSAAWDSDWVFSLTWTAPLDATPGIYAVTGNELVDVVFDGTVFQPDQSVDFPGIHQPTNFEIKPAQSAPEPSVVGLFACALLPLIIRRRRTAN